MNRTLGYKLLYIASVILLIGIAGCSILYFNLSTGGILLLALLFLIPGRIAGFFWRDFYRGRKLASMGAWEDAIVYFERFLAEVRRQPWLKQGYSNTGYDKLIQAAGEALANIEGRGIK